MKPGKKGFQFGLRHSRASNRALIVAMPNVEKDARATAGLGWVSVARNGAIVIYDDSPAVRLAG